MRFLSIITLLLSLHLYAESNLSDVSSQSLTLKKKIKDDGRICAPIEGDDFKELMRALKEYYNTTIKESYFNIV